MIKQTEGRNRLAYI